MYKNDKRSSRDIHDCQCYEHIDTWNDQRANIVNQILANAQDLDQHQVVKMCNKICTKEFQKFQTSAQDGRISRTSGQQFF